MSLPSEHRLDDAHYSLTEAGHDFWSYVDSRPGAAAHYGWRHDERCYEGYGHGKCEQWAHKRADRQCIAANSQLDRCSGEALGTMPFCGFHAKRAVEAVLVMLVDDERALLQRRLDVVREEAERDHRRTVESLRMEAALIDDVARAATRLPERVYFFAVAESDAVKIGRSVNPERRVRTLSTTKAPAGLDVRAGVLLGTIAGGCRVESSLHARFHAHRLDGEWFRLAPIRSAIDDLIAEAAQVEAGAA